MVIVRTESFDSLLQVVASLVSPARFYVTREDGKVRQITVVSGNVSVSYETAIEERIETDDLRLAGYVPVAGIFGI